jgi:DNA-binding transcriptional MerR regulator
MPDAELWTIDQLCQLVAAELVASEQSQPSARVREVPDRRTIRWYTTIGLLDRPAGMRGRTALYGRRHLLQVVAIKRLQATGIPLAEVQERLAGATSSTLERIAELSAGPARGPMRGPVPGPNRLAVPLAEGVPQPEANAAAAGRRRFWAVAEFPGAAAPRAAAQPASEPAARPAAQPPTRPAAQPTSGARLAFAAASRGPAPAGQASAEAGLAAGAGRYDTAMLPAIRLGGGAILTLSEAGRMPDSDDIAAIRHAAGPLLDLLRARGLGAHNIWEDR